MSGPHREFRAVLFDLDNTLLRRQPAFERFCRELYHTSGVMSSSHTEDQAVAMMVAWDDDGLRSRYDFFSDVMREWPGVFADLDQAIQVYLESYPRLMILEPPVRALLEDLRDSEVACGVVTNGGTVMQSNKLRESGLAGLVKGWAISEEVGVAKPDRRIFERGLALVESDAAETLFVGDSPEADIVGAIEVGMRTAWIRLDRQWPYNDARPDYVVDAVEDVRSIVLE